MDQCLFCQIFEGKIPAKKIYEDDKVIGFEDIHPQAKIHWLFIHKKHTKDFLEMAQDPQQITDIFQAIARAAKEHRIDHSGCRVVTNQGVDGLQSVFHTHFHVLAGEKLSGFGA